MRYSYESFLALCEADKIPLQIQVAWYEEFNCDLISVTRKCVRDCRIIALALVFILANVSLAALTGKTIFYISALTIWLIVSIIANKVKDISVDSAIWDVEMLEERLGVNFSSGAVDLPSLRETATKKLRELKGSASRAEIRLGLYYRLVKVRVLTEELDALA